MGAPSSLFLLVLAAAVSYGESSAPAEEICDDTANGKCLNDATGATSAAAGVAGDDTCRLYLAQSTIPGAGIGMFAGTPYEEGALLGRGYGDPAIPTLDHDWHNSPDNLSISKSSGDYHWPLVSYDWSAESIGMGKEGEDVGASVTGFGAAPNCHFSLLNVDEHSATYDTTNMDRYTSPGAGASTPYFNRTSTAMNDIAAGSELFVDYGESWFETRDDFALVPLEESYEAAQKFLNEYGKMLIGEYSGDEEEEDIEDEEENSEDEEEDVEWKEHLTEEHMILSDEVQKDLWDVIKSFPYPSRGQSALPSFYKDAIRAIHSDTKTIESENSIRSLEDLETHGKCLDNIVPGTSTIPDAGRGAFATRYIAQGGLVAPAPVVHIVDRSTMNMYDEMVGSNGNIVRNESALVSKQMHLNYCFGHPNSTMVLFPYSTSVSYINHHHTEYNAEVRWTEDFDFFHHKEWLNKSVDFLEDQWTAGMMLEFIATRDIQPGEEVFIDYGSAWDDAWRRHVENWAPLSPEGDTMSNYTVFDLTKRPGGANDTGGSESANSAGGADASVSGGVGAPEAKVPYMRAEVRNEDMDTPIKTSKEKLTDPDPHNVEIGCYVKLDNDMIYAFRPETVPFFKRHYIPVKDFDDHEFKQDCVVMERYEKTADHEDMYPYEEEGIDNSHPYLYTVQISTIKQYESFNVPENHTVVNVPRQALEFTNKHYTSDVLLKGAFRHEMLLPDGVFPRAWMNL